MKKNILNFLLFWGIFIVLNRVVYAKDFYWLKKVNMPSFFEPNPLRLHELTFGGSLWPNDAFHVGLAPNITYAFHFNPWWSWEVVQFHYLFQFNTSLKKRLAAYAVDVSPFEMRQLMHWAAFSSAILKPFYGKMAFFERRRIHLALNLGMGLGILRDEVGAKIAAQIISLSYFYLNQNLAIRCELRDTINFYDVSHLNNIVLGIGFSISFGQKEYRNMETEKDIF